MQYHGKFGFAALAGLMAITLSPALVPSAAGAADSVQMTSSALPVKHIVLKTTRPYADVKANIEKLGRFDDKMRAMLANNDIEGLRAAVTKATAEDGLAIHYIAQHGDLDALQGEKRQLIAYYIGNVLSASEMTIVNPAAGLYAPLRVVVYANDKGGTTMEYDLPSSMFGQFHDKKIDAVAASLDKRLLTFLKKVGS